jgi:putative N-acetylmannosamine-6-phosphate epimerase
MAGGALGIVVGKAILRFEQARRWFSRAAINNSSKFAS